MNEIIGEGGIIVLIKEVINDEMEGWFFGDSGCIVWYVVVDE